MMKRDGEALRQHENTLKGMRGTTSSTVSIEVTRRVEAKAAVLLSHISLMIAVTGVLWTAAGDGSKFEWLFAAELVLYLCLAIACIAIQFERSPRRARKLAAKEVDQKFVHLQSYANLTESRWKMKIFLMVQFLLPILTVLLVLTIVWFVFGGGFLQLIELLKNKAN